jgi:ribosomal protein S18 acetylase RimI-like enzyme
MPTTFEIRPVTREEAAAWRVLRAEALKNHPTAFGSSYEDFILLDDAAVAARIPEAGAADVLFGAYVDGLLSGCAGFMVETGSKERHKGFMWGVYAGPRLRGLGAGEALVVAVIEHAPRHVDLLRCVVSAANERAKGLYHRLGFRTYGLEPRALRVDGVDYDDELLVMSFDR